MTDDWNDVFRVETKGLVDRVIVKIIQGAERTPSGRPSIMQNVVDSVVVYPPGFIGLLFGDTLLRRIERAEKDMNSLCHKLNSNLVYHKQLASLTQ